MAMPRRSPTSWSRRASSALKRRRAMRAANITPTTWPSTESGTPTSERTRARQSAGTSTSEPAASSTRSARQLVALVLQALVLGDVDHEAAQTAVVGGMNAVAQPDLAAVGGGDAELVLEGPLGRQGLAVARQHALPIARVHDLAPEVRGAEPA